MSTYPGRHPSRRPLVEVALLASVAVNLALGLALLFVVLPQPAPQIEECRGELRNLLEVVLRSDEAKRLLADGVPGPDLDEQLRRKLIRLETR